MKRVGRTVDPGDGSYEDRGEIWLAVIHGPSYQKRGVLIATSAPRG